MKRLLLTCMTTAAILYIFVGIVFISYRIAEKIVEAGYVNQCLPDPYRTTGVMVCVSILAIVVVLFWRAYHQTMYWFRRCPVWWWPHRSITPMGYWLTASTIVLAVQAHLHASISIMGLFCVSAFILLLFLVNRLKSEGLPIGNDPADTTFLVYRYHTSSSCEPFEDTISVLPQNLRVGNKKRIWLFWLSEGWYWDGR